MADKGSKYWNSIRRGAVAFLRDHGRDLSGSKSNGRLALEVAAILGETVPVGYGHRRYLEECSRDGRIYGPRRRSSRKAREPRKPRVRRAAFGFYDSREWLALRYDILKTFGRVCMLCRTAEGEMHVDHIIPRSIRPDLELDKDNLQVLCRSCNLGKSNRDSTDFRP